jgi:Ca2+-binding EF-hand superfamily protein
MADLTAIIKKHFEPIFKAYDKDQSSTLEKGELRALLADNLGVNEAAITQEQLDWHFGKIDVDKDGKITFNEYVPLNVTLVQPLLRRESQEFDEGSKQGWQ